MPVLPEDRNFVLLAGDGYVAGTALALILFPEPQLSSKTVKGRHQKHEADQAKTALTIKFFAAAIAAGMAMIWTLGHFGALDSAGYHALPSDHSLFAAIPLFGIADMIAAGLAFVLARGEHKIVRQRELGDTTGQIFSISLASVYLGFWMVTILSSRW